MHSRVRSSPLIAFVVLAYSISWGAWGAGHLLTDDPILLTGAVMVGGFGPMAAAAVVVRATGERVVGTIRGPCLPIDAERVCTTGEGEKVLPERVWKPRCEPVTEAYFPLQFAPS